LTVLVPTSGALAHCYVGSRFFPATLNVDDPCVADELALPTISLFRNGDDPSARQLDISGEISKRITENFGISVGRAWTHLSPPGMRSVSGFQNWETSFKWQFLTIAPSELVMSAALAIEWGGTGSSAVGAERFNIYTPTLFIGKGFGDLPQSMGWARPFAVTGEVGYAIPSSASMSTFDPDSRTTDLERHPRFLRYGGSLQYSMPYLKANVVDLNLPDFVNSLIFIVETRFQTPVSNSFNTGIGTTGTINPGVIWVGRRFQVGVEALIPINRASGSNIGVMAQLHFYLDDIFPSTIGRPLLSTSTLTGLER